MRRWARCLRYEKGQQAERADSFGLVGISSTGAIFGVLITGLFLDGGKISGVLPEADITTENLLNVYGSKLFTIAWESFLTLLPIIIAFIVFQVFFFKYKKGRVIDIVRGITLTFAGLVVFLLGVNGGFMAVGARLGMQLDSMD